MRRVHLARNSGNPECVVFSTPHDVRVTTDKDEVTCKNCLRDIRLGRVGAVNPPVEHTVGNDLYWLSHFPRMSSGWLREYRFLKSVEEHLDELKLRDMIRLLQYAYHRQVRDQRDAKQRRRKR